MYLIDDHINLAIRLEFDRWIFLLKWYLTHIIEINAKRECDQYLNINLQYNNPTYAEILKNELYFKYYEPDQWIFVEQIYLYRMTNISQYRIC